MSWPKGRPRPKKVGSAVPVEVAEDLPIEANEATPPALPEGWRKGALLNVRNHGDAYVITLYPDEFDPRYPERAMRFTNLGECQDFVSQWYAPEHHDPRAR